MNLEREDKPSLGIAFFSGIFLSICLFAFYFFRGEVGNEASLSRLANIKSSVETGQLRFYTEPLVNLFLILIKRITGLKVLTAYNWGIAIIYSFFLHSAMLAFRRKEWKLNHFFLIYLIAFLPFAANLPYSHLEEMACLSSFFILYFFFQLERISDLFVIALFVVLAFLTDILMFSVGSLLFTTLICLRLMREKRTTVFFKRKNLPFRFMVGSYILFIFIVLLFVGTEFFGKNSFGFIFKEILEYIYRFFPVFLVLAIGEYLLRSERELNTLGTTAIVSVAIIVSGYFVFKTHFETTIHYKNIETEIVSLGARGKLLPTTNQIYGPKPMSDYIYYHSGGAIKYKDINLMKKKDYFIFSGANNNDRSFLEKKNTFSPGYFILDSNSFLLSKDLLDKVLSDKENSDTKAKLKIAIDTIPSFTTGYESFNRSLCSFFGL